MAMLERFKKDPVLFISGILAIVSCFIVYPDAEYIGYVDFRVLAILFCMMLVVSELVLLGVFDSLTNKLLSKVHSSRLVSLILVWLSFFLGMILTNDVTLVTLVPFAIALMKSFEDRKTLTFTLILTDKSGASSIFYIGIRNKSGLPLPSDWPSLEDWPDVSLFRDFGKCRKEGFLHAFRGEEYLCVRVHGSRIRAFLRFLYNLRERLSGTELIPQTVDEPHAHDVFQVAAVADTAFIGPVLGFASCIGQRLFGLDAENAPGAG